MRVEQVSETLFEKRLSTRERGEAEAITRLRDETTLLKALAGKVTPRLVEAGEDERGPWLRTEKLPFPTLAQRLAVASRNGLSLETAWVERAVSAAFAALALLHEAADEAGPLLVVHADLSPANIAIDDEGTRAVFLDLELASWRGAAARDGAFRGTIAYCAPELARGEAPTVQGDLFALAATLVHATSGLPPRAGPSLAALLAVAAEESLLDALATTVQLSQVELAARSKAHAALVRCLAHVACERPASARAVVTLLK